MDNNNDPEVDRRVAMAEEAIRETLSPAEPWIMRIQSLLVWEKPIQSVVLLVCIHALFWLLTVLTVRVYFIVPAALVIIMFLHTWKRKIWPEIRVPPPIPEDRDGWTEVHPRLLSVPEFSRRLAHILISIKVFIEGWLDFRREHSFMNCAVCSSFFICLWALGHYISGFMLSYILTMTLFLWPCMLYHSILQKMYMKCEPVFMKLDYCLKIRGKWPFRSKRSPRRTDTSPADGSQNQAEIETDSDIDDFVPSYDPETSAALARAITDSEDETGSSTQAISPQMSKEPSVNDNSDEDLVPHTWREADLVPQLDEMPSFDTVLDNTDDEFLDDIDMAQLQRKKGGRVMMRKKESKKKVGVLEQMILDQLKEALVAPETEAVSRDGQMTFVPTHFRDSESEEEETLTKDLDFTEASEHDAPTSGRDDNDAVAQLKSLFTPPDYSTNQQSMTSNDEPPQPSLVSMATSVMSQSLSSAVQAAYSGISTIGGNILPTRLTTTQEEAMREVAMEPEETVATGAAAAEGSRESSPGSEIEFLDEEFEFLDHYDDASESSRRK